MVEMLRSFVVAACALAVTTLDARDAEACACCDAYDNRTPVGWTKNGGAVLVEASTNAACEPKHWLEVWVVGAAEPSACYDLLADPNKRVACSDVETDETWRKRARRSRQTARFPRKGSALAATELRVLERQVDEPNGKALRIGVELNASGQWKRVWSATLLDASSEAHASATVWPNERGDRAMLIVKYTTHGTGNERTEVHWITVPTAAAP